MALCVVQLTISKLLVDILTPPPSAPSLSSGHECDPGFCSIKPKHDRHAQHQGKLQGVVGRQCFYMSGDNTLHQACAVASRRGLQKTWRL